MRDYSIEEQFALIALNGQASIYNTAAKEAAVFGIKMAKALQEMLINEQDGDDLEFSEALAENIRQTKGMRKKERRALEKETVDILKAEEVLTEIPNLLGCDMHYYTADVTMKEYRCEAALYQRIVESMRAEILEPGEPDLETVCLLWLFRESGCVHDIFSTQEQEQVETELIRLKGDSPRYRQLFDAEFHSAVGQTYIRFLRWKKNLFKNPYLEGVNLLFPFLDRKQTVFIDMVICGKTVQERRQMTIDFLRENGHSCEEMKNGSETLVKIDNSYYRIWPTTRSCRLPIQGVELLPVYR